MIPVNRPILDGNEKKYLAECIETGWISSEGPFVKKLEADFAKLMGCAHGVAVCNGSVAIEVALAALRIGAGDEVILPTFHHHFLRLGHCARGGYTRSGRLSAGYLESRPEPTRCQDHRPYQGHHGRSYLRATGRHGPGHRTGTSTRSVHHRGCRRTAWPDLQGRPIGSLGDIATVSFYPNKQITTGEGGMVLTNDQGAGRSMPRLAQPVFRQGAALYPRRARLELPHEQRSSGDRRGSARTH